MTSVPAGAAIAASQTNRGRFWGYHLKALSRRTLVGLALILAGIMSLWLEGRPKAAALAGGGYAHGAPDVRSAASPASPRRPCQNTNHAPCR